MFDLRVASKLVLPVPVLVLMMHLWFTSWMLVIRFGLQMMLMVEQLSNKSNESWIIWLSCLKMGCSVANALVINHDRGLGANNTVLIFIWFIVRLKGVHEEIRSLFRPFGLLLFINLVFFLLSFVCGYVCRCLGNSRMLYMDTIIIWCRMFLLAPSPILPVFVLLL